MNQINMTGNMYQLQIRQGGARPDGTITEFATFNISVPRRYKDKATGKRIYDSIPCIVNGGAVQFLKQYCNYEGATIAVTGDLRQHNYEKPMPNGTVEKVYTFQVQVDSIEGLDTPEEANRKRANTQMAQPQVQPQMQAQPQVQPQMQAQPQVQPQMQAQPQMAQPNMAFASPNINFS